MDSVTMTNKDWRKDYNQNSAFRHRVNTRIRMTFDSQMQTGFQKYGTDFVGDPLIHALQEAIGLVTYLATEIEVREMQSDSTL